MKKLLVLVLALSLVACMALSVSADNKITTSTGSNSVTAQINLTNEYENVGGENIAAATVHSVDVEWADTVFEYTYVTIAGETATKILTWDPDNHEYIVNNASSSSIDTSKSDWTAKDATVTVTNHSNAEVTATVTVADNDAGVTFTVTGGDDDGASAELADASVVAYQNTDAAAKATFTISASGTPTTSFTVAMTVTLG